MAENKYAQVLRWIADGEIVQWKPESCEWVDQRWESTLSEIANHEYQPESYRIAPRTLTIAGVEIEAPLTEAIQGQTVYASDATGRVAPFRFSEADIKGVEDALANGRLFATPEAAKAAYDAITALLTGKDAA